MSPLLPLQAGMAQIPIKICFVVAASKGVKANIHHEILKKHFVPWTNRSIIFHWQWTVQWQWQERGFGNFAC
jgi:hypothetical protein